MHDENCFITLTYRDADLPPGGSLRKKDFTDFMKRLRHEIRPRKISFFHCGEYGDALSRPHYHALIFGYDFPDKRFHKRTAQGAELHSSATLDRLWGFGYGTVGALTWQSAAYCARYVMKKITGERAESHYRRVDPDTGEIHLLVPEYATMSVRPAIGKRWFERYAEDVFPEDFVVHDGRKFSVPAYYDKLLDRADSGKLAAIKRGRVERANTKQARAESKPQRLAVREEVKTAALSLLTRKLK